jgi:hypothetical protein
MISFTSYQIGRKTVWSLDGWLSRVGLRGKSFPFLCEGEKLETDFLACTNGVLVSTAAREQARCDSANNRKLKSRKGQESSR